MRISMNVISAIRFGSFVCAAAYGFVVLGGDGWPRGGDNAAEMVSTAQNMATSMMALLSGSLLDPATYGLMWTSIPTPQYGVNPPADALRSLGWDKAIDTSAGPTEVIKDGQVPGYTSELILYPTSDSGVFVSFNTLDPHSAKSV
jgi:hypothetical protein